MPVLSPLSFPQSAPLSFPQGAPLSFPQSAPLSFPQVPPLSFPQVPPLSFPPVFSGNPVFFSSVLSFGGPRLGKTMDSRLKMSGMTRGRWNMSGMPEGGIVSSRFPLCHSRRVLAGIQCFSRLSFYWGAPLGKNHGFPIKDVGNARGGLTMSAMPEKGLKMSGIPEGGLTMSAMTGGESVRTRLPLCHSRRFSFCHSRRVLAGIQCFSFLSLSFVRPPWEKPMDSRLKMSGMTEGGLTMSGMPEKGLKMSGMPEGD